MFKKHDFHDVAWSHFLEIILSVSLATNDSLLLSNILWWVSMNTVAHGEPHNLMTSSRGHRSCAVGVSVQSQNESNTKRRKTLVISVPNYNHDVFFIHTYCYIYEEVVCFLKWIKQF